MIEKDNSKKALLTGVFAAIAASSCCIPPLIALVAGVGGSASSLSWMEPLRPYLIGFAILSIGYAWYAHLKPKQKDDCGCAIEKPKWYQTRGFLIGMTVFATLSIGLPYLTPYLYPDNKKETQLTSKENLEEIKIEIEGMTCTSCEQHIDYAVNELDGIISVKSSYENGNTIIQFDNTQISKEEIETGINETGYVVSTIKTK